MPRLGLRNLPKAPRRFDPAYAPESDFETLAAVKKEDVIRATSLRRYALRDRRNAAAACKLARRLARCSSHPRSLASCAYMRQVRRRIVAHLWRLIYQHPELPVSTVTIVARGWAIKQGILPSLRPKRLMEQLRTDLNYVGANSANGWGFFFLHGEYEPANGRYLPHLHGVVVGELIDAIEALSTRKKYRSTKRRDPIDGVGQRIRISRKPLSNMPRPLTYLVKSYWPSRRIGTVGQVGEANIGRTRRGMRIPEPGHATWLQWMHQWRLSDFALLYGIKVTAQGFQANKICTQKEEAVS